MRLLPLFIPALAAIMPAGMLQAGAAQLEGGASEVKVDLSSPPAHKAAPMVVEQSVDGLFYVEATVNNTPVHFVVDTGSSVVILSAADAARAGVSAAAAVDVDTAGGAAPMRRAQIDRIDLAGQTMAGVEAAIVKRDLKVSLLGQSVLSRLNAVTFKGGRMEFH